MEHVANVAILKKGGQWWISIVHQTPTAIQILLFLLMGINNIKKKNAAFCALLTEDPALWHERERMCLVYLAGHFSDPFAVQRSPKPARQILVSVHTPKGFCISLADMPPLPPAPEAGVALLSGEGVYIWPGAWGGEREGGLVEGRSAVPQLQRWGHSSIMRSCLWAASARCDWRCLRIKKLKLAFTEPARTSGRLGAPVRVCACASVLKIRSFTLLSFFYHNPQWSIFVPFCLN